MITNRINGKITPDDWKNIKVFLRTMGQRELKQLAKDTDRLGRLIEAQLCKHVFREIKATVRERRKRADL